MFLSDFCGWLSYVRLVRSKVTESSTEGLKDADEICYISKVKAGNEQWISILMASLVIRLESMQ